MSLTSSDPEPEPGTTVIDDLGRPWYRAHDQEHDGRANWTRPDTDGDDRESWVKVAGNYGPVTIDVW